MSALGRKHTSTESGSACSLVRTCRWAPNSSCSRVGQGSGLTFVYSCRTAVLQHGRPAATCPSIGNQADPGRQHHHPLVPLERPAIAAERVLGVPHRHPGRRRSRRLPRCSHSSSRDARRRRVARAVGVDPYPLTRDRHPQHRNRLNRRGRRRLRSPPPVPGRRLSGSPGV